MLQQRLQQKLQQKLSPQQIQLMKLLQIPTIALEQRIKEEMESNPALEEGDEAGETEDDLLDEHEEEKQENEDEFDLDDYLQDDDIPSYRLNANNAGKDIDDKTIPISVAKTFHEMLMTQLGLQMLDEEEYQIASHLIGSLDDDGYLRRELPAIVDDLAFTQNVIATEAQLQEQLKVVQNFEPPGIGARDLRECLILQMDRKELTEEAELIARQILQDHFDEFRKKHYDKI
ncbi:MAG TPA: RNA polymerase sigma-54 factor, partial [Flavobacteriales bacterium]|nr:RNA polymerase sigma-54 factor [Flavobacteriales bacterium]